MWHAGRVNAVIAEARGSLTTEESIKIPLNALADHSLSVRKTALQNIRNILHHHRAWLGGLLPATGAADGTAATTEHTVLLSSLIGALLKCCDPEVGIPPPPPPSCALICCRRQALGCHVYCCLFSPCWVTW